MLDKMMSYVPGGTEWNCVRVHSTTQNGTQLKTYKLSISEIFHLISLDGGWQWVTNMERESKIRETAG